MKRSLKWVSGALGATLFVVLVWKTGPSRLAAGMRSLGWGMAVLIALGGVSHLVKTAAWRLTLGSGRRPPFFWMFGVRLAGEAVAQMTFAGQVFGETTRALLLKRVLPLDRGVSSVVLDRALFTFTGAVVIVVAILSAPLAVTLPPQVQFYNALIAAGVLSGMAVAGLALGRRWPFISASLRLLERVGKFQKTAEEKRQGAQRVESLIHAFYHDSPRAFWTSFALNLTGHGFSVLEVFVALRFLETTASPVQAFVIEGLTKIVNFMGGVVPGNIGAYEGGNILIVQLMGMTAATGLTLGVARRLRGLTWGAVGLLVLFLHGSVGTTRRSDKGQSRS